MPCCSIFLDFRTILVEYPDGTDYYYDPYRDRGSHEHRKRGNKVHRTHSDLTGTKRKKRQKNRNESPYESSKGGRSSDKESRDRTASVDVYERQPYKGGNRQKIEHADDTNQNDIENRGLSQTDSAKLRAMNERNKEMEKPLANKWKTSDELCLDLPNDSDDDIVHSRPYEYKGKISNRSDRTDVYVPKREERKSQISKQERGQTVVNAEISPDVLERGSHTNPAFDNSEHPPDVIKPPLQKRESNADGKHTPWPYFIVLCRFLILYL